MLSKTAETLLLKRYAHKGESAEGVIKRVAKAISIRDDRFEKQLYDAMINGVWWPNSPAIRNAGKKKGMLSACFTGDTIINTTFGDIPAKELLGKKDFYVFSHDGERIRLGKADQIIKTGIKEVYKIKFDFGNSIKLTADHLILMRDGVYKKVENLKIGDRVMPFNYSYSTGRRRIKEGYKWKPSYILVYEEFYGVYNSKIDAIHHCDLNPKNDSPENLKKLTWSDHRKLHSEMNKGDKNVMKRPEMRKHFSDLMKGNKRALGAVRSEEFRRNLSEHNGMKRKEISEKVRQTNLLNGNYQKTDIQKENISIATKEVMWRPDVRKKYLVGLKNRDISGKNNGMYGVRRFGENNPNYRHGKYCSNHKVISIENLGTEEVYDIQSVDNFHNFAAEGIFIHNCFVLPIEDNIGSIFETVRNMALIFQRGGGVGINYSALRPKGASLSSGGSSSGALSFMNIFDSTIETVKQGGFRRGAALSALNYDHPEILDFCRAKLRGNLTNFNLSVMVTDDFMEKATNGGLVDLKHDGKVYRTVRAKDILDLITLGSWVSGDPGMLFYDRINRDNKSGVPITCTNPCGEQPLPNWGACCLGSINLSKFIEGTNFNFDRFYETVKLVGKMLLNINTMNWYPIPQITKTMQELNAVGVSIMGFADTLIMLGIKYDSQASLDFIDELSRPYIQASEEIAPDSFYKRSIVPTGSVSILANCSPSIEPIFATSFERHLTVGIIEETKDIYKSEYVRTAHEISPEWHLKVQAKFQSFIDSGVSKTVNVSSDIGADDIKQIYINAWKMGCKGVTVFRDGSIEGVLVSTEKEKMRCDDETCHL